MTVFGVPTGLRNTTVDELRELRTEVPSAWLPIPWPGAATDGVSSNRPVGPARSAAAREPETNPSSVQGSCLRQMHPVRVTPPA